MKCINVVVVASLLVFFLVSDIDYYEDDGDNASNSYKVDVDAGDYDKFDYETHCQSIS